MLARRYEAETLAEALSLVHGDLGQDALILYSREQDGSRWRRWIGAVGAEVIAMAPLPAFLESPAAPRPEDAAIALRVTAPVAPLLDLDGEPDLAPPDRPPTTHPPKVACAAPIRIAAGASRRVALIGATGVGKTTTIAKLACAYAFRGHSVGLVAADIYRMGAVAQLAGYARPLGAAFHVIEAPSQAARLRPQLDVCDLVLIDLPGIPSSVPDRLEATRALLEALAPHEVHLVLPVTASTNVIASTQEAFHSLRPSHAILTHLDEVATADLEPVLRTVMLPISYLGHGPNVPGDLVIARSRRAAAWLAPS